MGTLLAHRAYRFAVQRAALFFGALSLAALIGVSILLSSSPAEACGGFFCGRQPVDQTAERILFEVGQDSVTMTTQISYNGKAADFAWILPLSDVPALESLAVFPQKALNALDSNSGPNFLQPNDPACNQYRLLTPMAASAGPGAGSDNSAPPPVTVYIRAEVGPYDAAVVGSSSPTELVNWLRTAGYRITPAMEPYVARYTEEGMKFLALKLQDTADVKDLKPFRFTLPGYAPSIPLRMTALAAEPEMGIVVFVLGQRRFEGKNWANVEIADDQIRYNPFSYSFPVRTNWTQLVAKGVDEAGGQGWVTEFAGPSATYSAQVRTQVQNDSFATQEDREAARALLTSLEAYPYLTRLYSRLSAEEMTSDPVFGQSSLADLDREHQLSRIVNGVDQCAMEQRMSTDPCDFTTCGAPGLCRPVPVAATRLAPIGNGTTDVSTAIAGCACWAGATARLTLAPDGTTTVICQDGRLSFLNPGDREDDGLDVLPDPCAGFSCGTHGQCVSMNLTPTCVCDQGYVAVGQIAEEGTRQMNCLQPMQAVPAAFYASTLPALPEALPGGREVVLTTPEPMAAPGTTPPPAQSADFPMPRSNPELGPSQVPVAGSSRAGGGGCSLGATDSGATGWSWLAALGAAASLRRRRGDARGAERREPQRRKGLLAALAALASASVLLVSGKAEACGGFFCGRQPVDQTAERILFEVGQDSVTMTTQISFNGKAQDFAWILPLSDVPALESLAVFPQKALNALDSNSGPNFTPPSDPACYSCRFCDLSGAPYPAAANSGAESAPPPVMVYIRAEVGDYDVAVVGSSSPTELVNWLRTAGYRITPAMEPYVARYTEEGLKFLALKLQDTADVKDLKPFRFTVPGTAPSIPLRMTALAAEPEMGIVVFVLGQRRFEGKNWANVEIADDQIRYNPFSYSFPVATNWAQLVAKGVDTAGGQGWVTEFAGPSASYAEQVRSQVQNDNFATQEDREAARALLTSLDAYPYLTRLYTRVSAEEMTSDPVFGQSSLGDVDREHQLSRFVNGVDQCPMDERMSTDPCDFTTCGAPGLCRPVPVAATGMTPIANGTADVSAPVAGCACWAGATARLTFAPDGSTTVICQDGRLSFLNPGDREDDGLDVLPDPCAGFSCGDNGQCVSMNLTPTCVCDQGYVAVGQIANDGARRMNCVQPMQAVPAAFYASTLPALPEALPGGREVILTDPEPMAAPGTTAEPAQSADFPMPRSNPDLGPSQVPVRGSSSGGGGGCSLAVADAGAMGWGWLAALGAAASLRRRRSH